MEIEIITTKKKLTKSIVNQFRRANSSDIEYLLNGKDDGYHIINLGAKYTEKTGIFKSNDEWVKLSLLKVEQNRFRNIRYTAELGRLLGFDFTNKTLLEKYDQAKDKLLKNHLFI